MALPLAGSGEPLQSASPPLSGQIVKKSCYPRWNETFEFELAEGATEALCVEAWDWDLVSRNDFLGKVSTLPLQAAPASFSTRPHFQPSHPSSFPRKGCQGLPRTSNYASTPSPCLSLVPILWTLQKSTALGKEEN